ncbi:hypothetical protein [Solidesulfovibrio sp.]|jgi:hypothetical protein|uniref:hypothetical protein n=1 Tax=Solidesulfovibrio sp. TaxID=2910990 RepID=UPI002B20BF63|nr:hypothetical protein [Solidesulfovibrio sp.]MEA5089498.1 hypothetical protein [Solidesulfovibrio sp.]
MSFLGRFLVERGVVTEAQLEDGLRFQRENNRRIGEVAMDRGALTPGQVLAIRERQRDDPRLFGDIAVRERCLSRRDLDALLFLQKVQHVYLGEALLLRGHISREGYQALMGRHYALGAQGKLPLRYLQDFFADNKVAETLFAALAGAVRRFAGQPLEARDIGAPLDWEGFAQRALLVGRVPDGRTLEAGLGFSASLEAALAAGLGDAAGGRGMDAVFDAVLRDCGDLLRDASLCLAEGRVDRKRVFDRPAGDCLFVRGIAPAGEAALAVWLEERAG